MIKSVLWLYENTGRGCQRVIFNSWPRSSGDFGQRGFLPKGRHPLSITHAHLHIIPIYISRDNLEKLFDELELGLQFTIISLHNMKYKDYWMYRSENKHYYMSHSIKDAPKSCFIKLVAEQSGYDNSYEWRDPKNNRESDIKKTIKILDLLIKIWLYWDGCKTIS